jgi:SAM-dependent methyltransferase
MLQWLERFTGGEPIVGLDYSRDGLSFCRQRGHALLVHGSAAELPFAAASFDLVTSFEVLDELPDDRPGFDEIARVLRPGGWLFVRLPALEWLRSRHDAAMQTHRRTTAGELKAKLEARGLVVERSTYANSLLLPLVAAVRGARRLIPGEETRGSDVRPLPAGLAWVERIFRGCLLAEARFLTRPGARLPLGVSAICLARKI